jgi:hypothetical protein
MGITQRQTTFPVETRNVKYNNNNKKKKKKEGSERREERRSTAHVCVQ